jgi:hypothetical protein
VKEQANAAKLHGSSREGKRTDAEELESSSKVAVFGVSVTVRDATAGAATSGRSAPSTRQRETLTERVEIEPQPRAEPGGRGERSERTRRSCGGSSREGKRTDAEELESSSKVTVFGARLTARDATDGAATSRRCAPSTRQKERLTERVGIEPQPRAEAGGGGERSERTRRSSTVRRERGSELTPRSSSHRRRSRCSARGSRRATRLTVRPPHGAARPLRGRRRGSPSASESNHSLARRRGGERSERTRRSFGGSSREGKRTDAEELESSSKVTVFGVSLTVRDATDGAATSGRSAPSTRQRETLTERVGSNTASRGDGGGPCVQRRGRSRGRIRPWQPRAFGGRRAPKEGRADDEHRFEDHLEDGWEHARFAGALRHRARACGRLLGA